MVTAWTVWVGLLANAQVRELQVWLLKATLALAGILLLGAILIAVAKKLLQQAESSILSPNEQLSRFRALYERGELSKDEFARVKSLLAEQLREELEIPEIPVAEEAATNPGEVQPGTQPNQTKMDSGPTT